MVVLRRYDMAGSAIDLGISGGLFGEAPKLGAGMQSLMGSNAARGERVAESGRNAQYANVDLNDPASLREAATLAQKSGQPVKAKEFYDRSNTLTNNNNAQIAAQTAQDKTAEIERLTGLTEQARVGMLTPENKANYPVLYDQLLNEQITPVQAQNAINDKKAMSIVTADLKKEAMDEAAEQAVIASNIQKFIAHGGDAELTESWRFGTAPQSAKMLQEQMDLNPNSARNIQKEAVALKSEVGELFGAAQGMPNIAEQQLAMETISNNPMFWPIDEETGVATKGPLVFDRVSSDYVRAYREELKEAQIAKDNGTKNPWKAQTKGSMDLALQLSMDIGTSSSGFWGTLGDKTGYTDYDREAEWVSVLSQAIPSVQAGLFVSEVDAVEWIKNAVLKKKGDNPMTLTDLQQHVITEVNNAQLRREGKLPYPTQQPAGAGAPATTSTPEAETGADNLLAGIGEEEKKKK
jgi:hypothetical protein